MQELTAGNLGLPIHRGFSQEHDARQHAVQARQALVGRRHVATGVPEGKILQLQQRLCGVELIGLKRLLFSDTG